MIPWDFGIIRAIAEQIGISIFPSIPPEPLQQRSYIIFELKNILQGKNSLFRVSFTLTIVDNNEGKNLQILKLITKLISKELTLKQGDFVIGSSKMKIEEVDCRKEKMIISLVALLQLKNFYEDDDEDECDYEGE